MQHIYKRVLVFASLQTAFIDLADTFTQLLAFITIFYGILVRRIICAFFFIYYMYIEIHTCYKNELCRCFTHLNPLQFRLLDFLQNFFFLFAVRIRNWFLLNISDDKSFSVLRLCVCWGRCVVYMSIFHWTALWIRQFLFLSLMWLFATNQTIHNALSPNEYNESISKSSAMSRNKDQKTFFMLFSFEKQWNHWRNRAFSERFLD